LFGFNFFTNFAIVFIILKSMKKHLDFIGRMVGIIPKGGMVIHDNVTKMPVYEVPYITPYYIICISHQGSIVTDYDGRSVSFKPHDIAITYPQHLVVNHSSSPDYRATLIIITPDLMKKIHAINSSIDPFLFESIPQFHLTDQQYTDLMAVVDGLKVIVDVVKDVQNDLYYTGLLYIILYLINYYRNSDIGPSDTSVGTITTRLHEALAQHYAEHHDVNFYADLCCLSPKYFSTIVKQESGYPASHWIQQYLITMAKVLFQTEPSVTLQEVSDRLGFSEISAFSRFFRQQTGLSPSAYRKILLEEHKQDTRLN